MPDHSKITPLMTPLMIRTEIERLQKLRESLLSDDEILWDEVNAVDRDLSYLEQKLRQGKPE